jgi:hypothetical protein
MHFQWQLSLRIASLQKQYLVSDPIPLRARGLSCHRIDAAKKKLDHPAAAATSASFVALHCLFLFFQHEYQDLYLSLIKA